MKRIVLFALCAALAAVCLTGCVTVSFMGIDSVSGRGPQDRYEFEIGDINEIRVELFCDVDYYSAPSNTVTLDIQPNLMEYIRVEESGGVLTIRSTRAISTSGSDVPLLTVSTPMLTGLNLAGAGTFMAHDTIVADSFTVEFAGAGRGIADLDVGNLTINMTGAGSFELSGRADTADLSISGAGSLDALSLETRDASINLAGAGSVEIACSDNLRISAGGVGSVRYKGSPSVDLSRGGLVEVSKVG